MCIYMYMCTCGVCVMFVMCVYNVQYMYMYVSLSPPHQDKMMKLSSMRRLGHLWWGRGLTLPFRVEMPSE